MNALFSPLWRGLVAGATARERSGAPQPEALGFAGSLSQGLYWLGFEVTNAAVYGPKKVSASISGDR